MGGLFSKGTEQQKNSFSFTQPAPHRPTSNVQSSTSHATSDQYEQYATLQRQKVLEEKRRHKLMEEAQLCRRPLHRAVLQHSLAVSWVPMTSNTAFIRTDVTQHTEEYNVVTKLFKDTTKKQFYVIRIERIQNPYLLGCYLLKKNEMESMAGSYVTERRVFHGTKEHNVNSICENNFDWRLHGDSTGNRYGKGVSFSPISYYASHYSDKNAAVKVMFLVRVLISNIIEGHGDMTIPPLISHAYSHNNTMRYDTSQKENGHVIVKFFDNEYYPEYIIHYRVKPVTRKETNYINYDDTFY